MYLHQKNGDQEGLFLFLFWYHNFLCVKTSSKTNFYFMKAKPEYLVRPFWASVQFLTKLKVVSSSPDLLRWNQLLHRLCLEMEEVGGAQWLPPFFLLCRLGFFWSFWSSCVSSLIPKELSDQQLGAPKRLFKRQPLEPGGWGGGQSRPPGSWNV